MSQEKDSITSNPTDDGMPKQDETVFTSTPPPTNNMENQLSLPSIRETVGSTMTTISHLINDNLIAARFGIFAGVGLLTAYGLANTPLFFRYRTVSEVPAKYFIGRKWLHGRIIGVDSVEVGQDQKHIQILVRHLSPIGQVLPKSWFDTVMRYSPQAGRLGHGLRTKPEENMKDLLRVRIGGIQAPAVSKRVYKPEQVLQKLASERALISCQLLARQAPAEVEDPNASKRDISTVMPELLDQEDNHHQLRTALSDETYNAQQIAVCRITHRPKLLQLFATDIAESLVASGNANVSATLIAKDSSQQVLDSSQRLQDLRQDVKYLDRLAKAEFEAAKESMGMWSVPEVRDSKHELVEEVEFQTQATWWQKAWRWLRGG